MLLIEFKTKVNASAVIRNIKSKFHLDTEKTIFDNKKAQIDSIFLAKKLQMSKKAVTLQPVLCANNIKPTNI